MHLRWVWQWGPCPPARRHFAHFVLTGAAPHLPRGPGYLTCSSKQQFPCSRISPAGCCCASGTWVLPPGTESQLPSLRRVPLTPRCCPPLPCPAAAGAHMHMHKSAKKPSTRQVALIPGVATGRGPALSHKRGEQKHMKHLRPPCLLETRY